MIDAVVICDAPTNASNCDAQLEPAWQRPGELTIRAARAIAREHPSLTEVLDSVSRVDPLFMRNLADRCLPENIDAVAVHGFPRDWNLWSIHDRLANIDAIYRFRPEHLGPALHHRNRPRGAEAFAELATAITVREAPRQVVDATRPGLTAEELTHA